MKTVKLTVEVDYINDDVEVKPLAGDRSRRILTSRRKEIEESVTDALVCGHIGGFYAHIAPTGGVGSARVGRFRKRVICPVLEPSQGTWNRRPGGALRGSESCVSRSCWSVGTGAG
jgi:hypothetical protein